MKIGTGISKVHDFYEEAKKRKDILKPVSWALYKAWKYCDTYEKPRRMDNEQKTV